MDAGTHQGRLVTRRDFCLKACEVASLAALGGFLGSIVQSCSQPNNPADVASLPTINATVANGTIAISTGTGSPIAGVGSAALVQYSGGSILIAHTGSATFVAVSAVCTHQGCLITGYSGGTYTCPCHGSQFNTSGQVTRGPASAPLRTYATSVANDQVIITV
jgi:cytochrome b6-f complex iron-sulfur subunit